MHPVVKFVVFIICAFPGYLLNFPYPENPKVPMFSALVTGLLGAWIINRFYLLLRKRGVLGAPSADDPE